jgi:hypothetical protein
MLCKTAEPMWAFFLKISLKLFLLKEISMTYILLRGHFCQHFLIINEI